MLGRLLNICLLLLSLQASAQAWIFEVYGTLTESMGDQRGSFPELRIEEGSEFIARYSNRKNIIYLESLTVSIVDEHFGASRKDALAYILAHELGHFHFNHGWMRRTGERFASKETARELYKIGISKQQLLVDEEFGPKLIGKVKSQGVKHMDDSAMIMRIKFTTPPGEQFVMRREIFRRIQEAFAQNNIEFAHRNVTVYMPPESETSKDSDSLRAVAGSAAGSAVLDEEKSTAQGAAASSER